MYDSKFSSMSMGVPYCVSSVARSPTHTYRPLFLPQNARLRTPPPVIRNSQWTLPSDVPVLHTRDGYATPFFYYAAGCSDLHVRVHRMMVASNRVHALALIHKQAAASILQERCGHGLAATNWSASQVVARLSVEWADPLTPPRMAAFSSGECAHHLNAVLYNWMVRTNHDTFVLNFEYEGTPRIPLRWKAEIMHRGRIVYDANHTACSVHVLDKPCVHCGRRATPKTWEVCSHATDPTHR